MEITWVVREFAELSSMELYQILQLRIHVFMLEQECLYDECDNKDLKGKHLMGMMDDEVVAYARLLHPNVTYKEPCISRVVVKPSKRHLKLGTLLMQNAISNMHKYFPTAAIRISAQAHLQAFYENVGFVRVSAEPYLEDNIPHVEMELK